MAKRTFDAHHVGAVTLIAASLLIASLHTRASEPAVPPPERLLEVIQYQNALIDEATKVIEEQQKAIDRLRSATNCV